MSYVVRLVSVEHWDGLQVSQTSDLFYRTVWPSLAFLLATTMLRLINSLTCCCLCFVAKTLQGFCISSIHSKRLWGNIFSSTLIIKTPLQKIVCTTMHTHTHTQSTWPVLWTESLISLLSPNPKRLADLQHQLFMATLRNNHYLTSDRGMRGSKASPSLEWCLTELGSFRLVAGEVNTRAAPVKESAGRLWSTCLLVGKRREGFLKMYHVELLFN